MRMNRQNVFPCSDMLNAAHFRLIAFLFSKHFIITIQHSRVLLFPVLKKALHVSICVLFMQGAVRTSVSAFGLSLASLRSNKRTTVKNKLGLSSYRACRKNMGVDSIVGSSCSKGQGRDCIIPLLLPLLLRVFFQQINDHGYCWRGERFGW